MFDFLKRSKTDPEIMKQFEKLGKESSEISTKIGDLGSIIKKLKNQGKLVPKEDVINLKQLSLQSIEIHKQLEKFIKDNYAELSKSTSKQRLDKILHTCSAIAHDYPTFISNMEKEISSTQL